VFVVASCHPARGCLESQFELADESRVPKWFVVEAGKDRTQWDVTMTYWIGPSGRTATFELRGPEGRVRSVVGTQSGEAPLTIPPTKAGEPPDYPSFEVVTAEGATEIIEHRTYGTKFYVNDDPAVREALERQVGPTLR
jgi:hypothetical protein